MLAESRAVIKWAGQDTHCGRVAVRITPGDYI